MGYKASALFLLLVIISSVICAEKARYDFYRVYKVTAKNGEQIKLFQDIADHPDGYEFLSYPPAIVDAIAELLVPPHKFGEWSELVENHNLDVDLVSNNYQEHIDKEEESYLKRGTAYSWLNFWRLDETYAWMRDLERTYSYVSLFRVGMSFEGREIWGLRINLGNAPKKSIIVEATIHSNEWISLSSATYTINQLLTNRTADVLQLLETFDWWFVPILNVDGYEHTWNAARTWRKNRGPTTSAVCTGTDLNRNFDNFWGQFGSSTNPCAANYQGDRVESEVETRTWVSFLRTVPNIYGYLSIHSFGRMLMLPYAYTLDSTHNLGLLTEIGNEAVDAIERVRGIRFRLERMSFFFGRVSGISIDYATVNHRPQMVYVYELGTTHLIPPEEIIANGREVFASVAAIFKGVIDRGLV